MTASSTQFQMLSNGVLIDGPTQGEVINPYDESVVSTYPIADAAILDATVGAARQAFKSWKNTPFTERRQCIQKMADILDANAGALSEIITLEQGKPLERAKEEVLYSGVYARYFASLSVEPEVIANDESVTVELHREPIGVVAGICPWNFPLLIAVYKLAPALLAGNTLIIKPAPSTPLSALKLGDLVRDVFPPGVLNILSDNHELGPLISQHSDIDAISFTGSTAVGRAIMAGAAPTLKRLTLELGGNDPGIVLDDAEPKAIAEAIFGSAFFNSGQVCIAMKRLYVHRTLYPQLVEELGKLAQATVTGDGFAENSQFGPVQNRKQFDHVARLLESATAAGAHVVGGDRQTSGFCISPAIVSNISSDHPLVQTEQFGPVLPVVPYDDLDTLLDHINAGEFGLGASVWSSQVERARTVALQIDCGTVWVNQHLNFGPHIPLPAAKQSGNGVEWGREGFLEYTRPRVVNIAKSA